MRCDHHGPCAASLIFAAIPVLLSPARAQEPALNESQQQEKHSAEPATLGDFMKPARWLRLGADWRGRAEYQIDPGQGTDNRYFLNRLRLRFDATPTTWMRLFAEVQDARAAGFLGCPGCPPQRDSLDIRQAFLAFGSSEEGWQMRLGRQELSLGDERLLGADNFWDTFGQSFDAASVSFQGVRFSAAAMLGFRVEPGIRHPDRADKANRIAALSLQWKLGASERIVEPYMLWKRGANTTDLLARPGHRDVVTSGIRFAGPWLSKLDYNTEFAVQRGHVRGDAIAAWAQHAEVGWQPLGRGVGPRIGLEYNFASGDSHPGDRLHQTFDDLYPAGYNVFGITDPYAWRNIRYPAASAQMPLTRQWSLFAGYRSYWLATARDGLYPGGDDYITRVPLASSTRIGQHALISLEYARSARWRIAGGYGHLFAGPYLREANSVSSLHSGYLMTGFAF
ncbi:MAG: alginate export family protein [Bryobacterales bacterium]|nr:alginate export family protein [Bryobacterales bacterium]